MSSNKIQEAFDCLKDDNYEKFITLVPSEVPVDEKVCIFLKLCFKIFSNILVKCKIPDFCSC